MLYQQKSRDFFLEIDQSMLKFISKGNGLKIAKIILKKENKYGLTYQISSVNREKQSVFYKD